MFRGKGLAGFNFLEYSCLVEIVRIAKPGSKHADVRVDDNMSEHGDDAVAAEDNDDDDVRQPPAETEPSEDSRVTAVGKRKRSTTCRFDKHHKLYEHYEKKIRSKICVRILCGGRPPDFRSIIDDKTGRLFDYDEIGGRMKAAVNKAIEFYLVLLVPWRLQKDPEGRAVGELEPDIQAFTGRQDLPNNDLNWDNFVAFVQFLDGITVSEDGSQHYHRPSFLQRCRRQYLENVTRNLRTTKEAKRIVMEHRHKTSTKFGFGNHKQKLGICDLAEYITKKLRLRKSGAQGIGRGGEEDDGDEDG